MSRQKSLVNLCFHRRSAPKNGLKGFPQLLLHGQNSCLVLVDYKHESQWRKLPLFLWGHSAIQGFSWKKLFLVYYLSFLTESPQIPIPVLLAVRLILSSAQEHPWGDHDPRDPCAGTIFGDDVWDHCMWGCWGGFMPKFAGLELKGSSRASEGGRAAILRKTQQF